MEKKIRLEDIDSDYCMWCPEQYKDIADTTKQCNDCLFTVLYGEEDIDPNELEHLLKALENWCITECRECLFFVLCFPWEGEEEAFNY